MYRILCTDLDGTLLNSDGFVSSKNLAVIRKWLKGGRHLVIATARPLRDVLQLVPEDFCAQYIISYNGAEVYYQCRKVAELLISAKHLQTIFKYLRENFSERMIAMEIEGRLYSTHSVEHFWEGIDYTITDLSLKLDKPVNKILVDVENISDKDSLIRGIETVASIVITDKGRLGQIMAKNTNKLNSLKIILAKLQRNLSEVVAFGDDYNDIDLIREAGFGVAMENAVPELKQAAKFVTQSNNNDGIAYVLEMPALK